MVKVLTSIFKGQVAVVVQRVVNSDFPGYWRYLNSLVSILIGCGLTVIVQSSSVFISCLVPLVGMGLVDLDRVFPLALGANIGTTITGILAALSAPSDTLKPSLQIAFCHTLFNITGILIWFPLPFMRKVPLWLSKTLGEICGEYRWFAIFYLTFVFLVIPLLAFGLSLAGLAVFLGVIVPILFIIAAVVVINVLQSNKSRFLPHALRTWDFLPLFMRSLQPYDRFFTTYICRCNFNKASTIKPTNDGNEIEIVTIKKESSDLEKKIIYKF
jgi:sodium-dependent phosphate cotransporter